MATGEVSELYATFAQWLVAKGVVNLSNHEGVYVDQLGDFAFTLNPHPDPHQIKPGVELPPWALSVDTVEGFPLGVLDPFGGLLMVGVEDDCIRTLKAELARLGES